ncbi:hypothetical protein AADZ91_04900 [Colwelliaceae bacterium 6441]
MMQLTLLQQNIINAYQKELPLSSKPYQTMATSLGCDEVEVISALNDLDEQGVLSRVGPVFDHKKAGASTLAAIAVPPESLDKIAGIVNQFEQVNHNYAREHSYNLWFVATAIDPMALAETLQQIEQLTGLPILVLPMEASYHIDLGFKINFDKDNKAKPSSRNLVDETNDKIVIPDITHSLSVEQQGLLRKALEKGLPKTSMPYAQLAKRISVTEQQVQSQIYQWQQSGLIRRFGLVVKHRKLGFNANAMVVWNIPDELVDDIAGQLSSFDEVSLCYRRPRRLPDWSYNLFCMIHGKDRQVVLEQIATISEKLLSANPALSTGEKGIDKDILFSNKAYKQHGARYSKARQSTQTLECAHG